MVGEDVPPLRPVLEVVDHAAGDSRRCWRCCRRRRLICRRGWCGCRALWGRRRRRLSPRRRGGVLPPAVVVCVQEGDELLRRLQVSRGRGMVVAVGRVVQRVLSAIRCVLDRTFADAVVIGRARQDVVEVEDGHVFSRVSGQPVPGEPRVEGAGVGRVGRVLHRRRRHDDEELVGARAEVLQELVVDRLGVAHREPLAPRGGGRGPPLEVGVGEARFEHDDPVLTAGIAHLPRVRGVRVAASVERPRVRCALRPREPLGPVENVRPVPDGVRAPAVVCVAGEIVVLPEGPAQSAMAVGEPVFPAGVVDEDEFHGFFRGGGVLGRRRPDRDGERACQ